MLGHGKEPTERGELTFWRWQRERLVRTRKEINRASGTHVLETAEGGTCQDTERNRPSEGYSLPGNGRERNLLGHGKKPTKQGAPTSWRRQRERLVRTQKGTDQTRGTHQLETAEVRTCQDTERSRLSEGDSLPGPGNGRGLVRIRKEASRAKCTHQLETAEGGTCQDMERNRPSEGHSHPEDGRRRDLSGHGKKPTKRGALTLWRRQREGLVRTQK